MHHLLCLVLSVFPKILYLYISFTVVELEPVAATLSSTLLDNDDFYGAAKCIDGNTEGPDEGLPDVASDDFCHTEEEPTPWIAIDFGTTVTIQRVEIFWHCVTD